MSTGGENLATAYIDLEFRESTLNAALKKMESKVTKSLEETGRDASVALAKQMAQETREAQERMRAERRAYLEAHREKVTTQQQFYNEAKLRERERMNIILGVNDLLDEQIAREVAITNAIKQQNQAKAGGMGAGLAGAMMGGTFRQATNQLAYGLQDFITVLSMPGMGLAAALRGASNNASMLAMTLMTPLAGAITSVALAAVPMLVSAFTSTKEKAAEDKREIDALREAFERLQTVMQTQSKMRLAGDVSEVREVKSALSELTSEQKKLTESQARQADLKKAMENKTLPRHVTTVEATETDIRLMTKGPEFDIQNEEERRLAIAKERRRFAEQHGGTGVNILANGQVEIIRSPEGEEALELQKQIKELQKQLTDEAANQEVIQKRINALREKAAALAKEEADRERERNERLSNLTGAGATFDLPAAGRTVTAGRMSQASAERIADAFAELLKEDAETRKQEAAGNITPEMGRDMRAKSQRKFAELVGAENQKEADRYFNELESSNKSWQSKQEQARKFQFGLEMAGLGERKSFQVRRRQAEEQLDEDLRQNENMTRAGSDERTQGAELAVKKFKASQEQINRDELTAKRRLAIDTIRHSNPKAAAIAEADERKRQRLAELDRLNLTDEERKKMKAQIESAASAEKRDALKQVAKKTAPEFVGGEELSKKIQLALSVNDANEKAMLSAAQQTAKNTQELVTGVANLSGGVPALLN